jgi:2-dehydropantoate 2-reductase
MKTLVVGTGIIGTTWGWALSDAGIDVSHLVRPGTREKCQNGVTLDVLDGRKGHKKENVVKYDLKCVETIIPSDPYELIIVSVNFNQVDAVLDQLVPLSGDAIFLIFGANWFGVQPIEKQLPRERYLLGFPRGGGTQQDDMYYSVAIDPGVFLGEADGKRTEKLQRVESLFARADLPAQIPNNITHLLWTSHAIAIGYGAGLARSGDVNAFLRNRAAIIHAYNVTKEIFELCRRRGADPYKALSYSALYKLPPWLFTIVVKSLSVSTYGPGLKRILARLNQTANEKELREAMLKTAEELKFDMPRLKAVGGDL